MMRSWSATSDNGKRRVVSRSTPVPVPPAGSVRARVHAVGLDFGQNTSAAPRTVPAITYTGVIDAVGSGVYTWRVGDRVMTIDSFPKISASSAAAAPEKHGVVIDSCIIRPANEVMTPPSTLGFFDAAALSGNLLLAASAVLSSRLVGPGGKIGIMGSGTNAVFSAGLSRAIGGDVVVIAKDSDWAKKASLAGQSYTFIPNETDWVKRSRLYARHGFDKIIVTEPVGDLEPALSALAANGELVLTFADQAIASFEALAGKTGTVRSITTVTRNQLEHFFYQIVLHVVRPTFQLISWQDAFADGEVPASPEWLNGSVISFEGLGGLSVT